MSDMILKNDGSPFTTEHAAKTKQTVLSKEGVHTEPVKIEGGFALQQVQKRRPKRAKLGKRNVTTVKAPEGFRARVVNDVGDRLQQFEEAGWRVLKDDQNMGDSRVGSPNKIGSAVSKGVGGGITGVVMIKPEDEFQEDYNERQDEIDRWEREMKLQNKQSGRYGKIRIGEL